jgi:hypothetical protein
MLALFPAFALRSWQALFTLRTGQARLALLPNLTFWPRLALRPRLAIWPLRPFWPGRPRITFWPELAPLALLTRGTR